MIKAFNNYMINVEKSKINSLIRDTRFEPISFEEYNRELDIAIQQIANGDVFSEEEVTEIIKGWGRKSHEEAIPTRFSKPCSFK